MCLLHPHFTESLKGKRFFFQGYFFKCHSDVILFLTTRSEKNNSFSLLDPWKATEKIFFSKPFPAFEKYFLFCLSGVQQWDQFFLSLPWKKYFFRLKKICFSLAFQGFRILWLSAQQNSPICYSETTISTFFRHLFWKYLLAASLNSSLVTLVLVVRIT